MNQHIQLSSAHALPLFQKTTKEFCIIKVLIPRTHPFPLFLLYSTLTTHLRSRDPKIESICVCFHFNSLRLVGDLGSAERL
jgi:hypothetical protein